MEDQIDKSMAVFHQICEVNELNPQTILQEVQQQQHDKVEVDQKAERLIWAALDQRARVLLQGIAAGASIKGDKAEYSIDADPAAPAFVVNEAYIRSQHSPDAAEKMIDALAQVHLPVQG